MRGFKMVLFTASRGNNFLGVTCPLPSTLLVFKYVATLSNFVRYADIAQLFCKSLELNRFAVHYLIPRICKIVQLQRMSRRYVESPFTSPRRLFYSDCSECLLSARSREFICGYCTAFVLLVYLDNSLNIQALLVCPAMSGPASLSVIVLSCNVRPCKFGCPSLSCPAISVNPFLRRKVLGQQNIKIAQL